MATIVGTFRKDPNATLDYGFDWSDWLESADTLAAAVWTVPTGLTNGGTQLGTDTTKITISGGTAGEQYTVACKVTTNDGRVDERSFGVQVEHR